ncbi:MAG: imidazole glycerol phosphate synthase subunit HisF [Rhodospirillales bacterium]
MTNIRLIARLDVKAPNLIKGVHLEGLRKLGEPRAFAERYYHDGIDEIIYIDAVASLYERNTIVDLVRETAENVFIPITAGGGVRSVADARQLLRAGADKIAINTAAVRNPNLISEIAGALGSQCMVLSVQAKRRPEGGWEAYCDQGREHSGRDVIEWVREAEGLGAGEILLTSVDQEGTLKGFDVDLVRAVSDTVRIPVIASGGAGGVDHLAQVVTGGGATAVAMAHILHYSKATVLGLRDEMCNRGFSVRSFRDVA